MSVIAHMAEAQDTEVVDEEEPKDPSKVTRARAAKILGVSQRMIFRFEHAGKLTRLTPKNVSPQLFSLEEVNALKASRARMKEEAQGAALAKVDGQVAERSLVAQSVVDLVGAANDHSEEFARLALKVADQLLQRALGDNDKVRTHYEKESARLIARIEKLEGERDEVLAVADAQRKQLYDLELAKAEVVKKVKLYEAGKDFLGMLAPGLVARFSPNAPNMGVIQKTGFRRVWDSLTDEQRMGMMAQLTPEQQGAIAMLFADEDEAKQDAKQETPEPKETP